MVCLHHRKWGNPSKLGLSDTVWDNYAADNSYCTGKIPQEASYAAEFTDEIQPNSLVDIGRNAGGSRGLDLLNPLIGKDKISPASNTGVLHPLSGSRNSDITEYFIFEKENKISHCRSQVS